MTAWTSLMWDEGIVILMVWIIILILAFLTCNTLELLLNRSFWIILPLRSELYAFWVGVSKWLYVGTTSQITASKQQLCPSEDFRGYWRRLDTQQTGHAQIVNIIDILGGAFLSRTFIFLGHHGVWKISLATLSMEESWMEVLPNSTKFLEFSPGLSPCIKNCFQSMTHMTHKQAGEGSVLTMYSPNCKLQMGPYLSGTKILYCNSRINTTATPVPNSTDYGCYNLF